MIRQLSGLLSHTYQESLSDAELVRQFGDSGDGISFGELVRRHGPMVLGVARRIVRDHHAAEDVLQATFIRLSRQASRLHHPAALATWLHRTATNIALTALRSRKRRECLEARALSRTPTDPVDQVLNREVLNVLDEELHRLPEAYRLPIILCCLEGRSHIDAARQLGWTEASVKGRLERGRQRLRNRICRRGLQLPGSMPTFVLGEIPAVNGLLKKATMDAALKGLVVAPNVAAMAAGVGQSVFGLIWKSALAAVVAASMGVAGWAMLSSPHAEEPPKPSGKEQAGGGLEEILPKGAVGRLGSARLRIGNAAFALAPDGKTIITVSPEGIVRVFDANNGNLLQRRQIGERLDVNSVGQGSAQLSSDGKTVAMTENGIYERRVVVRDVPSGKLLFCRDSNADRNLGTFALSPNGKSLALVEHRQKPTRTQMLCVFDLPDGRMKELGKAPLNTYDAQFSADGTRLAIFELNDQSSEWTYAYFDVTQGKELWQLPTNGQQFALSPNGKILISALNGSGFQIIETDLITGKPTETFKAYQPAHPNMPVVIAPDNRTVVMSHADDKLLWDLETGMEIGRIRLPQRTGGYGPKLGAFSSDGKSFATNRGVLQRWHIPSGEPFFDAPEEDALGGPVEHIAFCNGGKEIFTSSFSITSSRWDVATAKCLEQISGERLGRRFIATPDGLRSVMSKYAETPNEIMVFDPVAGELLRTVEWAPADELNNNSLRAYTLTADGKQFLAVHSDKKSQNCFVTASDATSGQRLSQFHVPGNLYFLYPPFSLCGRLVVLGDKLYHVPTGRKLYVPKADDGMKLLAGDRWGRSPVWFSGDSRLLAGRLAAQTGHATTSTNELAVWEVASGKILTRFPQGRLASQVAYAPDGRTLAFVDGWGIRLHDLATGKLLASYEATDVASDAIDRGNSTQTLAFAPDGKTLATGHTDGSILFWKVPRPTLVKTTAIPESELEVLWADLGGNSPAKAMTVVDRLASQPTQAINLLAARFQQPADTTQRLPLSGEQLRGVRAVEVLERVGTPEAKALLQRWTEQKPDSIMVAEAKFALERLKALTKLKSANEE